MDTIPSISKKMRDILVHTANKAARLTHFVQRRSKLTGAVFAQSLVLGWLHQPDASLDALTQTAGSLGVDISPQGLDKRFTPQAAALLQEVLNAMVSEVIATSPAAIPVLRRFTAVILQDSSTISLPPTLSDIWQGCGNDTVTASAALKIHVRLDIANGTLQGPLLQHGRDNDHRSPLQSAPVPPGALRIADLGFFSLDTFRDLATNGAFFLSRLQANTAVFNRDGSPLNLPQTLCRQDAGTTDMPVQLGSRHRFPARLLAARVPPAVADSRRQQLRDEARRQGKAVSITRLALADWTILVTNAPQEMLSLAEALVLARTRWQIELLFKLWKEHGQIDEWRSAKPWRILCEVYAKLAAMVIQHWVLLTSDWTYPERSLVKATQIVRSHAPMLVAAMAGVIEIALVLKHIRDCLSKGCRMNKRRQHPNTHQRLMALPNAA